MRWSLRTAERFREILDTLARRRLRTALTALSVAWGIFMLVILLASGKGLENGATSEFGEDAMNSVWVNSGRMSRAYAGNPVGKWIRLTNEDHALLRENVGGVEHSSGRVRVNQLVISTPGRDASFQVRGAEPPYALIEGSHLTAGRFLNTDDLKEKRKVAVIGKQVAETLFPGAEAVGETIAIQGVGYRVIGVFSEALDEDEQQTIYVPLTTAQLVYGRSIGSWGPMGGGARTSGAGGAGGAAGTAARGGRTTLAATIAATSARTTTGGASDRLDTIALTIDAKTLKDNDAAVDNIRRTLAARQGFDPEDKRALRVWSNFEVQARVLGLFAGIRFFIWVIGLGTILAGVVGVGNIMLISVQERVREFGVRKAVGASPASIVAMILQEALVITIASGYLGLVAGVAVVELGGRLLPPDAFLRSPSVNMGVALGATAVLVIAGTLAGLFPALRAARVNPITALRVE